MKGFKIEDKIANCYKLSITQFIKEYNFKSNEIVFDNKVIKHLIRIIIPKKKVLDK